MRNRITPSVRGGNGVTVVYDQNLWEQPVMAQDDTLSLTAGNQLSYTVVLFADDRHLRIF